MQVPSKPLIVSQDLPGEYVFDQMYRWFVFFAMGRCNFCRAQPTNQAWQTFLGIVYTTSVTNNSRSFCIYI